MISIKTQSEIEIMRQGGKILASILKLVLKKENFTAYYLKWKFGFESGNK